MKSFASLMASQSSTTRIPARIAGGQPEEIVTRMVSGSYFTTLGVPATLGRTFTTDDDRAEGAAPYAVISHEFWQRRFGGRADAIGSSIALAGGTFSVIGVAPATFFGETVGDRPDAWLPLVMQATVMPGRDWLRENPAKAEKVMWLHAFATAASRRHLETAQANANVVFQQGLAAYYGSSGLHRRGSQALPRISGCACVRPRPARRSFATASPNRSTSCSAPPRSSS